MLEQLRCAAGHHCPGGNNASVVCPEGEFQNEGGMTSCEDCYDGYYCVARTTEPTACTAGRYAPRPKLGHHDDCVQCSLGHYCEAGASSFSNGVQVAPCEPGRYGSTPGRPDYKCSGTCEPGYYCPAGSTSGTQQACPAGRYNPRTLLASVDQCELCDVGYYCPEAATRPQPCAAFNQGEDNPYTTVGSGSASAVDCVCRQGKFGVPRANASQDNGPLVSCVTCRAGAANCTAKGVIRHELYVTPDHWRVNINSSVVLECSIPDACIGGINVEELCRVGHTGPFCGVCDITDPADKYYKQVSGECASCNDTSGAFVPIIGFVAVLVVVIVLMRQVEHMKKTLDAKTEEQKAKDTSQATAVKEVVIMAKEVVDEKLKKIGRRLRIFVALWQILGAMGPVYSLRFPPGFTNLLSFTAILQFDLFAAFPLDCYFDSDFHSKLITKTMGPILFSLIGVTIGIIAKYCLGKPKVLGIIMSGILALLFLVYTGIMQDTFGTFLCIDLDDGTSVLQLDLSIDCDADAHQTMRMYALLMICIYPIGFPLLIWIILNNHKSVLHDLRNKEKELEAKKLIEKLSQIVEVKRLNRPHSIPTPRTRVSNTSHPLHFEPRAELPLVCVRTRGQANGVN
jgi:hypothetical protein